MKTRQKVSLLCTVFVSVFFAGCQFSDRPRMRFGTYPTSTLGATFLNPDGLGPHGYRYNASEKDGLVYTCRGGHLDIAHVRIAADWTRYLSKRSYNCLMKDKSGFSFRLLVEPSKCHVKIEYPDEWDEMSEEQKEQIAREGSIELAQYLAFSVTTWHEILTWFGFKCILLLPEYPSAFSWDDSYSNLVGTHIGAEALRNTEMKYEEAVAAAIDHELEEQGAQPASVGKAASESVRGDWFSGPSLFMVDMRMRNLDIGLDDGFVTPTIIPGVSQCEGSEPLSYPAPKLDFLKSKGFSVKVEIQPREWESGKILRIVSKKKGSKIKRIEPDTDFSIIMAYIHEDALKKDYIVYPPSFETQTVTSAVEQANQAN